MYVENAGNPLANSTTSFDISRFTLDKIHMNAGNVENYLATSTTSLNTREFTQEKGHINAMNVGNHFVKALHSSNTGDFTLDKSISVVNTENALLKTNLILHGTHTGEKCYACSEYGKSFHEALSFFDILEFMLEKVS